MNFPRKRTIMAFHRWIGILSAIFLGLLSITGLALNHTEMLGLDRVTIRSGWILERYGMEGGSGMKSFRMDNAGILTYLDGYLFLESSMIGEGSLPSGTWSSDSLIVVSTASEVILLTEEGELIEKLGIDQLPGSVITGLGSIGGDKPLLVMDTGPWEPDAGWLEFSRYQGDFSMPELVEITISPTHRKALLAQYQGEGVSLYRVILDLHSGRLLGLPGRAVMDLTALAVLLLVSSGIAGWLRKSRMPRY